MEEEEEGRTMPKRPCSCACMVGLQLTSWHGQVLWTFSIYLEAVAIIPQLVLLQRTQNIDNLTGNYVFLLGCAALPGHA